MGKKKTKEDVLSDCLLSVDLCFQLHSIIYKTKLRSTCTTTGKPKLLILKNSTNLDKIVQSLQFSLYYNMLLHWEDSGMNSLMCHMQKSTASNLSQSLTSFKSLRHRKPEKVLKTNCLPPEQLLILHDMDISHLLHTVNFNVIHRNI